MNNVSIRLFLIINIATIALLMVVMFITGQVLNSAIQKAFELQNNRYQSYLLADELRQSSDDLTRLARTYVVSEGEPTYEQQYNDILDIRNGKKPRPAEYYRIYWDFLAAGQAKPRPDTTTIALTELMKQTGFSKAEFGKLNEAKANSDDLVQTEVRAMNAVKGLFPDTQGNYTVKATPDLALARKLMHSREYHEFKAKIMAPLDDFFALLDKRTLQAAQDAEARVSFLHSLLNSFEIVTILSTLLLGWLLYKKVVPPLRLLSDNAKSMANGHFDFTLTINSKDEVGTLMQSVGLLQGAVQSIIADADTLHNSAVAGNLATRAEATKHQGDFRKIVEGFNATLDAVINPLNVASTYVDSIAKGEIPAKITDTYNGDFNTIKITSILVLMQ